MDFGIKDDSVRALAEYISSASFQSKFEQFFLDHALTFTDDQEHHLEYMTVYHAFQKLFNEHMEAFLIVHNITEEEFEKRCHHAIETDPKADQYLDVVIASTDYDAFFNLMKAMRTRAAMEKDHKAAVADTKSSAKDDGDKATTKEPTSSTNSDRSRDPAQAKSEGKSARSDAIDDKAAAKRSADDAKEVASKSRKD